MQFDPQRHRVIEAHRPHRPGMILRTVLVLTPAVVVFALLTWMALHPR